MKGEGERQVKLFSCQNCCLYLYGLCNNPQVGAQGMLSNTAL